MTTVASAGTGTLGIPVQGWHHRHLIDLDVVTWPEIELIMRTTDEMNHILARPIRKVPALNGRRVTTLFYEASTRTRVSFETAARNLSADVVSVSTATSSVTKGESLVDTIRTLEALGAEILVMRHSVSGAPYLAALIELLRPAAMAAIGRSAAVLLPEGSPMLRHPAHGGATLFRDGLTALAAGLAMGQDR